jgi:hypothetical protein
MNKLTLDLEALRVDSFDTAHAADENGKAQGLSGWSDDSVCPTVGPSPRCPY